jgi:transposase-like protein
MKKHSGTTCPRCKDGDFVEVVEVNTDTVWLRCKSCLLHWTDLPTNVTAHQEELKAIRHHPADVVTRKASVRAVG